MNPLLRRVKTQEEKDALLKQAKAEWDALDPAISHLVAASEQDYLSKIADSIIVEREPFTPARELTAERAHQDGELMFMRLYGDRADSSDTGIAALDALTKANKEESLRKLLGPGQRAESELEGLIRSMVLKAIDNPSAPRRGVLGIVERMATWSAGEDSDAARFVRAYVANDTAAQREIARSLAAA